MLMFEEAVVEAVVVSLLFPEFLNCFCLTPSNKLAEEMGSAPGLLKLLSLGFPKASQGSRNQRSIASPQGLLFSLLSVLV